MTIEKVAKLAGVSNSTVSRVINNHPRIAPDTRRAVQEAMQQLDYTPSERRPGPKPHSQRASQARVGFLILGIAEGATTPGFTDLLRGVSAGAADNNLNLHFAYMPDSSQLPQMFIDQRLDGILLHGVPPTGKALEHLQSVPSVWLMGNRQRPQWGDQVMPDMLGIGELAAHVLIEKQHQRLAFINLDGGHWSLAACGSIFAGTALEADRSVEMIVNEQTGAGSYWRPFGSEPVAEIVQNFLELDPQPTGLFIAESMQAAIVQPALQQRGVEIGPGKVEIVTCNNEQPYLFGLMPRPTVIDNRIEAIGRQGVHQLVWRMAHATVGDRLQLTIKPTLAPPVEV